MSDSLLMHRKHLDGFRSALAAVRTLYLSNGAYPETRQSDGNSARRELIAYLRSLIDQVQTRPAFDRESPPDDALRDPSLEIALHEAHPDFAEAIPSARALIERLASGAAMSIDELSLLDRLILLRARLNADDDFDGALQNERAARIGVQDRPASGLA